MSEKLHPCHNKVDKINVTDHSCLEEFDRYDSWRENLSNMGIIGDLGTHRWLTLSQSSFCSVKAFRNS